MLDSQTNDRYALEKYTSPEQRVKDVPFTYFLNGALQATGAENFEMLSNISTNSYITSLIVVRPNCKSFSTHEN